MKNAIGRLAAPKSSGLSIRDRAEPHIRAFAAAEAARKDGPITGPTEVPASRAGTRRLGAPSENPMEEVGHGVGNCLPISSFGLSLYRLRLCFAAYSLV
jgi:hypothetical protein